MIQWIFLGLLTIMTVAVLVSHRWRRTSGLAVVFFLAFAALFLHQAYWQIHGGASSALLNFRRAYDKRPATVTQLTEERGRILDRHGALLAEAIPGKRWEQKMPLGAASLHVVGHLSREYGVSGLTRVYDRWLSGVSAAPTLSPLRPQPQDLTTTLDAKLQRLAYRLLNGRKGAVVALEPTSGEILALVSSPSVSPTDAALHKAVKDTANAPLFNRATQGLYAPGSVFKIFTAALALEHIPTEKYICPQQGWSPAFSTKPIRDSHPMGERAIGLFPAFAESSNIWFAKAAQKLGWANFAAAAQRTGMTRPFTLAQHTDRSLGTATPIFPDYADTPNRLAYLGFGQGDLRVTPLHIALLTAAVANGGALPTPTLTLHSDHLAPPQRLWDATRAAQLKALMRASVTEGTSQGMNSLPFAVAGKTGTAENEGADHAWFTCFAPAEKPRIVITVLVENGGFGAASALPIARTLLSAYL